MMELEQSILFRKCHSDVSVNFLLDQLISVTLLVVVVADIILLIANVPASAGFHMLEMMLDLTDQIVQHLICYY